MRVRHLPALVMVVIALFGCDSTPPAPACSQAELDVEAPAEMPTPVIVERDRRLGTWTMKAAVANAPVLAAEKAWPTLLAALGPGGGGEHEMLLGTLTDKPVLDERMVWVRLTRGRAMLLAPSAAPENLATPAGPDCAYFDVVAAADAVTGEVVAGAAYTSRH